MGSVRGLAAVAALVGAVAVVGCGGDGESSSPTRVLNVSIAEPAPNRVAFTAPASVQAGAVRIRFTNRGRQPHDATLLRLDGGHTVTEALRVIDSEGGPIPDWLHAVGGVATVQPGQSSTSVQNLAPGRYHLVDLESGEAENAPSGADRGAIANLEVTGEAGTAQLPATTAQIAAYEYGFRTQGLKPGRNNVLFDNTGAQLHHAVAAPILPGRSLAEVRTFAVSENAPGPPPIDFERTASTAVLDGQTKQVVELDLRRGRYALLCFIQDRAGGPPHVVKGMIGEVTVR
jgi:plastocyanin